MVRVSDRQDRTVKSSTRRRGFRQDRRTRLRLLGPRLAPGIGATPHAATAGLPGGRAEAADEACPTQPAQGAVCRGLAALGRRTLTLNKYTGSEQGNPQTGHPN
jgi:hypothetical protein